MAQKVHYVLSTISTVRSKKTKLQRLDVAERDRHQSEPRRQLRAANIVDASAHQKVAEEPTHPFRSAGFP